MRLKLNGFLSSLLISCLLLIVGFPSLVFSTVIIDGTLDFSFDGDAPDSAWLIAPIPEQGAYLGVINTVVEEVEGSNAYINGDRAAPILILAQLPIVAL